MRKLNVSLIRYRNHMIRICTLVLEIYHTTLYRKTAHTVYENLRPSGINDTSLANSRIQDPMLAPTLADIPTVA